MPSGGQKKFGFGSVRLGSVGFGSVRGGSRTSETAREGADGCLMLKLSPPMLDSHPAVGTVFEGPARCNLQNEKTPRTRNALDGLRLSVERLRHCLNRRKNFVCPVAVFVTTLFVPTTVGSGVASAQVFVIRLVFHCKWKGGLLVAQIRRTKSVGTA
jgi:hypothetical protein